MTVLTIRPVPGMPEVHAGDDLVSLVAEHLDVPLHPYDIVVVTSKVVSKAAGLVSVGDRDRLIDEATDRLVARRGPTRIVRTRHGLTMAAAGLDESNTEPGTVVALPADPDAEAAALRGRLLGRYPELAGRVAVVVTDTAGRAWRVGQTDLAIGVAGLRPLRSYAGTRDPYGNELRVTQPALADEIAGAADLAAGKLAGTPVAIVRGVDAAEFTSDDGPGAVALIREESEDLFGLGAHQAVVEALGSTGGRPRGFAEVPVESTELVRVALGGLDARSLEVKVEGAGAASVLTTSRADSAAVSDACLELGALLERLRVLGRAFGVRVDHQPAGSDPAAVRITVGG